MAREYKWGQLRERGDWVHHPDTLVNQVARLAKKYVERNLPPGSQVTTVTVPDGTVTFLSYVPEMLEDPQPTHVGHRPPTQRELDKRAKDQERREREMEERNERADTLARSRSKIASDSAGFPAWKRSLTPEEIEAAAKADRHAARVQAAISEGITGKEFADIVAEGDDL